MFVHHSKAMKALVQSVYFEGQWHVRDIAHFFKISLSTLYRWIHAPKQQRKQIRGRKPSLSPEAHAWIKKHVIRYKQCQMDKMQTALFDKFQARVSSRTIYRSLKMQGVTCKKAHFHAKAPDPRKLLDFSLYLKNIPSSNIIALDESSFDTHMTPSRGWSRKGTKCVFIPNTTRARKRFSLIMAISNQKVLAWELIQGSFNKQRFLNFLNTQLLPNMIQTNTGNVFTHVLMDNLSFHRSKETIETLHHANCSALFIPPYNPDSNPIEMLFALIKTTARMYQPTTERSIRIMLRKEVTRIEQRQVLFNFFKHALEHKTSSSCRV